MSAIDDIAAERRRQIEVEGWTTKHDAGHFAGEMARAAAAYAVYGSMPKDRVFQVDVYGRSRYGGERQYQFGWFLPATMLWPWDADWWKPKDPRRDLVRAGALIVAEIERLDRSNGT